MNPMARSSFYQPAPDPGGYTDLLKVAYPRSKAADPSATVIGGVLGAVVDWGNFTMNPIGFLEGMYTAGAKNFMDAVSYHPYHYSAKFSDAVTIANSSANQMQMQGHGRQR